MSDKAKNFTAPAVKSKRPSTVSATTTSSRNVEKDKNVTRPKINKITMLKHEGSVPDFDTEYRQVAYGKVLRAMLENCLVDEKIEREETMIDMQITRLANRYQLTMDHLEKTNRRLKDISFVAEQKRLIDLKNQDSSQFFEMIEKSNAVDILKDLTVTEHACLDKLDTKNIDFGFNKETGHKQLLDAVTDATEGLELIKKHSDLDFNKFKEYEQSQKSLEELQKDRFDLESLKAEFEVKFPQFGERLMREASEKVARMLQNDDEVLD